MKNIKVPSLTFIFLIFLTAFCMEAIGTYISVVGLGTLFAGDPVIITMTVILDIAKIVGVSLLYQYWIHPMIKRLRLYLLPAVLVLMVISSAGTFGYLSNAFQKALAPNMAVSLKVDAYNKERDMLVSERADLQKQTAQMNEQIVHEEDPKRKQNLIWSFRSETKRIAQRIPVVSKRIDELNGMVLQVESENIESRVHAGPITYISKAFGVSLEDASKYIILTIVGVFDPLAIIFILAGNFMIKLRREILEPAPGPEPPKPWVVPIDSSTGSTSMVQPEAEKVAQEAATAQALKQEAELKSRTEVRTRKRRKPDGDAKLQTVRVENPKLLGPDERALITEEKVLLDRVYDPIDRGESPDDVETDRTLDEALVQEVKDYVPVVPEEPIRAVQEPQAELVQAEPVIDVYAEGKFAGTPQTSLIQPRRATLQDPNINKSL